VTYIAKTTKPLEALLKRRYRKYLRKQAQLDDYQSSSCDKENDNVYQKKRKRKNVKAEKSSVFDSDAKKLKYAHTGQEG
jgi:hypothetical protein